MKPPWKWVGLLLAAVALAATAKASSTPHLLTVPIMAKIGITPARIGVSGAILEIVVRKSGHVAAFAALGFGLRWAETPVGWSLFCGLLWAVTDEYRQTFTPGRDGRLSDVFIDLSGILLGLCVAWVLVRWGAEKASKPE